MIDFNKTFLNQEAKIYECTADKIISLKDGSFLPIKGKEASIYSKNFQLKFKLNFKNELADVLQLKTNEILLLIADYYANYLLLYDDKTFKLISKISDFHNESAGVERMFELSNSTLALCFSASYGINIFERNNNDFKYLKTIDTKYCCYSACEIDNSNIAYNCTFNYKCEEYDICFSHNDKCIKDLCITCSRDSLYFFRKKNLLLANGMECTYVIDLNKYELINSFTIEDQLFYHNDKTLCLIDDYIIIPGCKYKIFVLKWNERNKKSELINSFNFDDSIKVSEKEDDNLRWQFIQNSRLLFLNKKIYIYRIKGKIGEFNLFYE